MLLTNAKKFIFFALIPLLLFNTSSGAQTHEGEKVITIRVKGNQAISTATILSKVKTQPGGKLEQEVINDDIKRLYALGYFTDVAIDVEEYEEGIMITIILEEKPVIKEITFEGNKKIRTPRLKKTMQVKEGDMLNFTKLAADITEIRSLYERNGFNKANVKYEIEKDKDLNQASIKIIVNESQRLRIKRVYVEGNENVKTNKITVLMKTKPAWLFRRGYFDDAEFENDLAKIKAYYQDLGYLDVSVEPSFSYNEEKGLMDITLKITEGPIYRLGSIMIKGNIVFPEDKIKGKIAIKTGNPFSYSKLREDVENVRSMYYQEGYMNAEVGVDRTIKPAEHVLDVIFDIDAKEIVYVGTVDIRGNTKTKDVVIRRELRIYPGERFDGDQIRRSKERLYNLGFFEDIYFETTPTGEPDVNDLNISVKETKTGEFSFGGGYSSVDEFIGFAQITQKNFDLFNFPYFTGDGQNLAIRAELGTVRSNYDVSWTEPWIFDYPVSFGLDGYRRTHWRTTHVGYGYQEVRTGGDARLGKEFMEYFRSDLMYKLENVSISDIADEATQDLKDEEGDNWISSVVLGTQFDNTDNIYSPTRGVVAGISLENAGGPIMGDKDFVKGFLWTNLYFSPIKSVVIELKGRAGLADSYSNTEKVPIYERFYAGGANTIRGYEERKVGPRDPNSNDPVGGDATLIGNIELSFPIYEKVIKGAVFYDIGNVWENIGDFAQGSYKMGAGVGVRVKTPIGPVKLDWGYPLSDNNDDKKEGRFYFSMSHGF